MRLLYIRIFGWDTNLVRKTTVVAYTNRAATLFTVTIVMHDWNHRSAQPCDLPSLLIEKTSPGFENT